MNSLILFIGVTFILWLGSSLLIPLLIAAFLWYLINATATYYRKLLPGAENRAWLNTTYKILSNILSLLTFAGLIYLFATHVRPMFTELLAVVPHIQTKLDALWAFASNKLGVDIAFNTLPSLNTIIASVGSSITKIATSMGMVIVYMIFMFVEQSTFHRKFAVLFPNKSQHKKIRFILHSIDENMKKYLFMKTLLSCITGLLSYFWMHTLGLEFAGVWAFVIFVLSYIPTIGAIISCSLPILFSLVSFETINQPVLIGVGLIGLQIIFGNILEPKLTGKTLNLSTLAILINLVFWGLLWGVAGMFFSVPLLVATFIITAQFDSTRWIAILLSADGKIPDKNGD